MSELTISTLSRSSASGRVDAEAAAELVVLIECDRPSAGSSRHRLAGVDEVVLGRGLQRAVERSGSRLTLRFEDPRMSTLHASISREPGGFVLTDRQSKNGVVVNGRRVEQHVLRDRDVLECGRTFLLFSERSVRQPDEPPDVHAAELPSALGLVTFHEPLAEQLRALEEVARTDLPVLILGASGTGKELLSRAIHERSARRGAFVAVNCGALPENLVEAELFGVRKGAFTGATEERPGLVRASDEGTLFLDEIGDLPLRAQPTLLRVLQEREVVPIGGTRASTVNLRVIAATHRDLEAAANAERFRSDLLARLSGFVIRLPSLRERLEDFGLLTSALLARHGGVDVTISGSAMRALLTHSWPLNVRQLEHTLRAALAQSPRRVDRVELPRATTPPAAGPPPVAAARPLTAEQQARREELCALLILHRGNVSAVARQLGKDRVQIRRWIKAFGISVDELLR